MVASFDWSDLAYLALTIFLVLAGSRWIRRASGSAEPWAALLR
jgi:hypothetical protein